MPGEVMMEDWSLKGILLFELQSYYLFGNTMRSPNNFDLPQRRRERREKPLATNGTN
jgi:hypothetical protein